MIAGMTLADTMPSTQRIRTLCRPSCKGSDSLYSDNVLIIPLSTYLLERPSDDDIADLVGAVGIVRNGKRGQLSHDGIAVL